MEPHRRPEIVNDNCGLMSNLLNKIGFWNSRKEKFDYRDNSIIVILEATIIVIQILAYRDNSNSEVHKIPFQSSSILTFDRYQIFNRSY